jgi:hypothetical protein
MTSQATDERGPFGTGVYQYSISAPIRRTAGTGEAGLAAEKIRRVELREMAAQVPLP